MVEKPGHVAWGHVKLKLVTWVVVVPTSNHIGSHIYSIDVSHHPPLL
jgi:hypothetical protein